MCIVLHIISYLDLINEIIGEIGHQLNLKKKSEEELENCSKIIVIMVTQVIQNVSVLSELYTYFFLLMEFAAFGSLIIFGLTCLVLHQQYAIAISILHVAAELYIICYVSEKVNDKFLNIAANISPGTNWHRKKEKSFYVQCYVKILASNSKPLEFIM